MVGPAGGEIEHPTAADGRELVAVAHEGDTGTVFVGDREQSAGSVLVEHPGFVHQQQVTRPQGGLGSRLAVDAGPAGVFVPPPTVLVRKPRSGECPGADLPCRDSRRLEGRCHHDHSLVLPVERGSSGSEGGGLAGAGCTFDDDQVLTAGKACHDLQLGLVDVVRRYERRPTWFAAGSGSQPLGDIGLHFEHLPRRQRPDVLWQARLLQERHTRRDCAR